jgi:hypothetical protein
MKSMKPAIALFLLLAAPPMLAQSQAAGNQTAGSKAADNMQILQQKVQADRKFVVASNMNLTQDEANKFWPIYDGYIDQLKEINQKTLAMIQKYANFYNAGTLTDEKAGQLIQEMFTLEGDVLKLQEAYAADLGKVLPQKKVARALQIENKLRAIAMYHLAAQIPLAQ